MADNNADGGFADAGEEFDTLLAGEADTEDNQIDASDVTAFANNFGLTTQAALDSADIDSDGDVLKSDRLCVGTQCDNGLRLYNEPLDQSSQYL